MVAQIKVTVNGGSVSSVAFRSTYPGAAVKFDEVLEGTRVDSFLRDWQRESGQYIELPFHPKGADVTPDGIVEERAVAALLASLRAIDPEENGTPLAAEKGTA